MELLFMWGLLVFIVIQRLMELKIAKKNELWMKERGGVERGRGHYKWFVIVHGLFFISIVIEFSYRGFPTEQFTFVLFTLFVFTQLIRIWCIRSLGKFWNTKIIISPGFSLVRKGPYKYVKHPNYIIVGIELFIIPLLFGAYVTSVVFPILHVLLLFVRIPVENRALVEAYHVEK
ncbi:isoprenylcysteine carboxyl methyltransferase family protein [Virgibacillus sp. SK37]|uniref:isoprenylcysteine carboxyl methyltransferase family protein n=1 Tax=Virgibacillus sp. SK37 TaxID=403957 RepID=UPI0004D0B2E5|nr:isoprenylcysteine carboxylmethyltransferase family protein [Virgibacillus sp. SK37]AIF43608.1 isoprenylcysteine carboxyl methyltransferase [Virgibacillus sp. SK37]